MSPVEERLIKEVTSLPNLIRLVQTGKADQVIRVAPFEAQTLWLDRGPDIEKWEQIKREIYLKAPAEQKVPVPVDVGDQQGWKIGAADVPFIDLAPQHAVAASGSRK